MLNDADVRKKVSKLKPYNFTFKLKHPPFFVGKNSNIPNNIMLRIRQLYLFFFFGTNIDDKRVSVSTWLKVRDT